MKLFFRAVPSILMLVAGAAVATPPGDVPHAAEVGADAGVKDWQGTPYQSGGDGAESRMVLDRRLRQFNLRILLSEGRRSAYVAGAELSIVDGRGQERLRLTDAGPYVDVRLPAGRYVVQARTGGHSRQAVVQIGTAALARVHLHWPESQDEAAPAAGPGALP
ncbi:hypothetical protein X805_06720 [Sphaerotilus natans subsp. natans DSM 6575]|uniref:Carboxypeptidase regulatory-like domain-containing protein n=1 Tax=Sphaerotilus natans subsp. natans DSM 6575 TaxID=1286631 RepID=A0A059KR36_9BURK|nr:hypothetical protein [Sphaerotilus natans]KDB53694.1 hypothetical protein X805_06720 [Sphaerotilus natans subsp. natans DSM 6575]SIQ43654.1 hypothetical protein SAMN05421778_10362 [Sphaerotilus natans]